jgi:para-aminobenzoate synthetase component 2
MILLVDNYDSFVYNLARYLEELGEVVRVVRNDATTVDEVAAWSPSHVVLSPGPCTPAEAGVSVELLRELDPRIPILGVCLGHQCIAAAFGGAVVRATRPMHGVVRPVLHEGSGLFAGLPSPFEVTRYHSLVIDPSDPGSGVAVTARSEDGEVMAVAHRERAIWGVQFHPEAVRTFGGHRMLANFLALGRDESPDEVAIPAASSVELARDDRDGPADDSADSLPYGRSASPPR